MNTPTAAFEPRYFVTSAGRCIDVLNPATGRGLYGNKTQEQMELECGFRLDIITSEEAHDRIRATFTTPLRRETQGCFEYALEILPPCNLTRAHGALSFYVSEGISGDVHAFHIAMDGEHWTCNRPKTTTHAEMVREVLTARLEEAGYLHDPDPGKPEPEWVTAIRAKLAQVAP